MWAALLSSILLLYGAALLALFVGQRRLLYFPNRREIRPESVGLSQAERIHLKTDDGERLLAWRIAPTNNAPVIVYFHGNGGGIGERANRYATFSAAGFGVLAVEYRGYAGSTGRPSEAGLLRDAEAAYRAARLDAPASRVVLLGESLGSGLAVNLASRLEVGAVVLDSPFTSVVDVAAALFPLIPVRRMLRDRFDSAARISRLKAPLLVVHHARDLTVPIRFGRRLYEMAPTPKRFIEIPGLGHPAMDACLAETIAWIAEQGPAPVS